MRCASGFCFRAIDVLIYINDIANAVPNKKVRLFADDSNLFLARSTAPSVADAANNTMFKLNNWFLANKLSLNTNKFLYGISTRYICGVAFPMEWMCVATYLLNAESINACRCGVANKSRMI